MTKVLILIPWFSPAIQAGGPIQSISNLVKKDIDGINFDVFCSNKDLDGHELNGIITNQWVNYNNNTRVWYSSSSFPFFQLKKLVDGQQIDKIFIIGLYSLSYNILPWILFNKSNRVISVRGMLHPEALKIKWFKKYIYLLSLKLFDFHKRVQYHATDDVEKTYINNVLGNDQVVHVAGNFISYFEGANSIQKKSGRLTLLTIALISPMKNHLLILKALAQCKCEIEYHIVGAIKDENYWNDCKEIIKILPGNISVKFHGQVEHHEISKLIDGSTVMILPSRSENFGHAIIESLFAGMPVITSFQTPWNNLQFHNAGVNIQPQTDSILEAIEYFASLDHTSYARCSDAAKRYAHEVYNENIIIQEYKKMFQIRA